MDDILEAPRPPSRDAPSLPDDPLSPTPAALHSYLADATVRQRMVEFLGGATLEDATCRYLSPTAPTLAHPFAPRPVRDLWALLEEEGEVARSLWDQGDLIADLDVEHVHYDKPWEPLRHRERSRQLQEPVVEAITALLREYGVTPLHFLSGRGHHWLWRIPRRSRCFFELERLGTLNAALQQRYAQPGLPFSEAVGLRLGAAYAGLGKLMEFFGHRILERTSGRSAIPVELTAATVPAGPGGREAISIDLSLYGDPLDRRAVRLPFSPYLKGRRLGEPQLLVAVPVASGREDEAFAAASDLDAAAALAQSVSTAIPRAAEGTLLLLRHYLTSDLAAVHRAFYAAEPDPVAEWPATYDRLDLDSLPPCVARILAGPNDLLLQPAAIQLVVRVLMALGWVPRHVAGLLRSKYERDHGWIPEIHFHEPSCRAEFYVRLFTGLALTRKEDLEDFNCAATRGRSLCTQPQCRWNLADLRAILRS